MVARSDPIDPSPVAPRLPASLAATRHGAVFPHDEWQDEEIHESDLSGQVADRVEIVGCELRGLRFTGARLERLRLVDVVARDCDLSGALLSEAFLLRVEFRNCRMAGLVISATKLSHVRFTDCKLDGANFRFSTAARVLFDSCSLIEADFAGAGFTTTAFDSCDLTKAEFSQTSADLVRLVGSTLDGVRGAAGLSGAVIAGDQVLPLALSVFADLGIVVEAADD